MYSLASPSPSSSSGCLQCGRLDAIHVQWMNRQDDIIPIHFVYMVAGNARPSSVYEHMVDVHLFTHKIVRFHSLSQNQCKCKNIEYLKRKKVWMAKKRIQIHDWSTRFVYVWCVCVCVWWREHIARWRASVAYWCSCSMTRNEIVQIFYLTRHRNHCFVFCNKQHLTPLVFDVARWWRRRRQRQRPRL